MTHLRIALALTEDHDDVARYLPGNYEVIGRTIWPEEMGILIAGIDDHGWNMEQYVIPRLGSALIACREIFPGLPKTEHDKNTISHDSHDSHDKGERE